MPCAYEQSSSACGAVVVFNNAVSNVTLYDAFTSKSITDSDSVPLLASRRIRILEESTNSIALDPSGLMLKFADVPCLVSVIASGVAVNESNGALKFIVAKIG